MLVVEEDLRIAEAVLDQKGSRRSERRVSYTELICHAQDYGPAPFVVPLIFDRLAELADSVE